MFVLSFMEFLSFDNFISLIIVFISWILILFLLSAKTKNRLSNYILVAFLLVFAQDSSGLFASFFIYPKYPGLGLLINSTVFLKMPLLYLYLLSVIYSDFKLTKKLLWHLIPFVLNFIIFLPRYYLADFDAKWAFLNTEDYYRIPEIILSYTLVHLQIVLYGLLSFLLIKKYKRLLLENFSNASLFNYNWLFQLVGIIMLSALIATLKNIFKFIHVDEAYKYTYFATAMVTLGLISWMVLKALHNPEIFRGINSDLQLIKNFNPGDLRKQTGEQKEVTETDEIASLKRYMDNNEPFLDPSLSVEELATQVNMPTKELSFLINHDLNQHFFDFVNSYRIQKAKKILENQEKSNLTILEILYEVGFNSKSSFNTAFKRHTDTTPTEYRKNNLKSAS